MSALFGLCSQASIDAQPLLRVMDETLRHRGGDSLLSHVRDRSAVCLRPRHNTSSHRADTTLARNGLTLALAGYLLNCPADPLAAILSAYEREGTKALEDLKGSFILALLDGDTLHLIRDQAGGRSCYYARPEQGLFCFASETKAFLGLPGFVPRMDAASVLQFFSCSFAFGPNTMLQGVSSLPPGSRLVADMAAGTVSVYRYAAFEDTEKDPSVPDGAWAGQFRLLLDEAVANRLPTGENVAVFLSGGLDSSAVAASVTRLHSAPVHTFSLHFGPSYPNEIAFAREVAHSLGTQHHEICIRPKDFLPEMERIAWLLDEPVGDPITAPNYFLARHAADVAAWVFNGEGGDPLFGGPKNVPMLLDHWYGGVGEGDIATRRARAYLSSFKRCYSDLENLFTRDFLDSINHDKDLIDPLAAFFRASSPSSFLDRLQWMNIMLKGAHLILPKVERMLGAWGLGSLSPLFDESLLHLAFALPGRLKLECGVEKIVMKKALRGVLPDKIVDRPKSGMRVPVRFWLRGEMRDHAAELLSEKAVREAGIFRPGRIRELLGYDPDSYPSNFGLTLWMIITFELWRSMFIQGKRP